MLSIEVSTRNAWSGTRLSLILRERRQDLKKKESTK
jgi:hypothetical protein